MTDDEFIELAERRLDGLGTVSLLRDVPTPARQFGMQEMLVLVDQALALVSSFYVNLALKREIHATDPEQALRNLRNELVDIERGGMESISEDEFHERLSAIFVGLRDRHTVYELPDPYRRTIAFLPFVVEHCEPDGVGSTYFVTKVLGDRPDGFKTPETVDEAPRITHWNGVPIARAVALNGERNAGANRAARMARGLERLTFRWLGTTTGPDEEWVEVGYEIGNQVYKQWFPWYAIQAEADFVDHATAGGTGIGRDLEGEWIRRVKAKLHTTLDLGTSCKDRVAFREHTLDDDSTYGYLRVYTFDVEPEEADAFLAEVTRLVRGAPAAGLIIDVRGNPGGLIPAAERMLGLFSPGPVELQSLFFRNTPEATSLAECLYATRANALGNNVMEARATAAPFIASLALDEDDVTETQVYQGPVMVLFDALTYSAAEVFTAGMLDQGLALAGGTVRQTGGGGANVWPYGLVRETLADAAPYGLVRETLADAAQLPELPEAASFNVSIRRITRVGTRRGVALEDLGVLVDPAEVIPLTPEDLVNGNRALLTAAAEILREQEHYSITAVHDGNRTFTLTSAGIDRAVVLFDDNLFRGISAPNGQSVSVPDGEPMPANVTFLGYDGGVRPVTSFRCTLG